MSAIPPGWLGSIIQTSGAQRRAAAAKSVQEAATDEKASFPDRLADVIESSDRDSQVYSDAEGSGSQGRSDTGGQPGKPASSEAPTPQGGGLDLEA